MLYSTSYPSHGTHLCSFLLVATFLTTSMALGREANSVKIVLSLPFLTHAPLSPPPPPPLFLPHFLCATLRWARSSSTTNTASLVPAEKKRHWNMREWKGRRWGEEDGGVSAEELSPTVNVMATYLWKA